MRPLTLSAYRKRDSLVPRVWRGGTFFAFALAFAAIAAADTVTLPVAASATGVGGVPFVSDVRVFNTSYTDVLNVTAVYRFNGMTQVFQLAPREARGFDDICVSLFSTPQSLGAVEFTSDKDGLLVTSQLRSPVTGGGHVGMFVPGLPSSAASIVSVLTSLVNGDSRTNVGVYNPNDASVTATIRLFDGNVLLGTTAVQLTAHAVTQVNNIYNVLGFASLVKTEGYATVESSGGPLFTYAAEADNSSGDLILVVGAPDQPAPPGFNPPSPTPAGAGATPTPTAPAATPTPTVKPTPPPGNVVMVNVGPNGTRSFDPPNVSIHVGDTVQWVWQGFGHSSTSGSCCTMDGKWDSGVFSTPHQFSFQFTTAGNFPYFCSQHLSEMTGSVQVNP
ncbi:MAG TPA: plastocyanin/azurin family copper-binding protein [Thermoanaerobaculia bacterium]